MIGFEPERFGEVGFTALRIAVLVADGAARVGGLGVSRVAGDDLGNVLVGGGEVVAVEMKLRPPEEVARRILRVVGERRGYHDALAHAA